MEITAEMIKALRAATNAGVLDCRKALQATNGDFEKAVEYLREKGMVTASKRADRAASDGVVELYSHGGGRVGVMVEVNCETGKKGAVVDKIIEGRLEKFKDETCLLRQPYIRDEALTIEKLIMQNVGTLGENIVVRRFQRWELGESSDQTP